MSPARVQPLTIPEGARQCLDFLSCTAAPAAPPTASSKQAGTSSASICSPEFAKFWAAGTNGAPIIYSDAIVALDILLAGGELTDSDGQEWHISDFDAVGGGPPCIAYCPISKGTNAHIDYTEKMFTEVTRERFNELNRRGWPTYLENPGARPDVVLCGAAMGLSVLRHRKVEIGGWDCPKPAHPKHEGYVRGWRHGVYRDGVWPDGRVFKAFHGDGGGKGTIAEASEALGIDWVTDMDVLVEMLPPAYGKYLGTELKKHLHNLYAF